MTSRKYPTYKRIAAVACGTAAAVVALETWRRTYRAQVSISDSGGESVATLPGKDGAKDSPFDSEDDTSTRYISSAIQFRNWS